MLLNQFLLLSAVLFCLGVYGVLARKNGMLVLMSVELILNAVNINLVAFGAFRADVGGSVFALFTIAVAAAEVGMIFVGIDVIGGYITEINVTSPTGLQEINAFDNICLESDIWDAIEAKL